MTILTAIGSVLAVPLFTILGVLVWPLSMLSIIF